MAGVKFDATKEEMRHAERIVERIKSLYIKHDNLGEFDRQTWLMDILACHCNGTPLDLEKLSNAPDFDFSHDVFGIRQHINRETGQIENCFLPRTSK